MRSAQVNRDGGADRCWDRLPGRSQGDDGDKTHVRGWPDVVQEPKRRSPHEYGPGALAKSRPVTDNSPLRTTPEQRDLEHQAHRGDKGHLGIGSPRLYQPPPTNRPLPVSGVSGLDGASLVLSKGILSGILVVSFQNQESLINVIQDILILLSFSDDNPIGKSDSLLIIPWALTGELITAVFAKYVRAKYLALRRRRRRRRIDNPVTDIELAEPAREDAFAMEAHVAFRLRQSKPVNDMPRDGTTRNPQCIDMTVSAVMVLHEEGTRLDMIPLEPATGCLILPAMPACVRITQTMPKKAVYQEHDCNGRQFSTLSKLARQRRGMSGPAVKATCPSCGATFKRLSARENHLLHRKCKAALEPAVSSLAGMEAEWDQLPFQDTTTMFDHLSARDSARLRVLRA